MPERLTMAMLFTIGTTRKSLQRFIELLRGEKVGTVVDTRLNNTSQLAGFSKKEDLEFLLSEGFGIGYEHRPELAPSAPLLAAFQNDRDWERYRAGFLEEMEARGMRAVLLGLLDQHEHPCLLCACDRADTCHRRLLAEALQKERPGLEVKHLR
jgi:uncharacterized protein (DUF488 family)